MVKKSNFKPKSSPEPETPETIPEAETMPPESPEPEMIGHHGGSGSTSEHLDALDGEILEPEGDGDQSAGGHDASGDAAGAYADPPVPPGALSFAAWYEIMWKRGHQVAGGFTGLQTVMAGPNHPLSEEAARSFYRSCCRTKYLHFMLRPMPWLADIVIVAAYAVPFSVAVAEELKARRAAGTAESTTAKPGDAAGPVEDDPITRAQKADMA